MDRFLVKTVPVRSSTDVASSSELPAKASESESKNEKALTEGSNLSNNFLTKGEPIIRKRKLVVPYRSEWKFNYTWLIEEENTKQGKRCKLCNTAIVGGKTHIERHALTETHKKAIESAKQTCRIDQLVDKNVEISSINAKKFEISLALFVAEHNLPFTVLDHLNLILKSNLIDSKTVKSMTINRHKGQQIIKNITGPENTATIAEITKRQYISVVIDESTDSTTTKNLAIIIRVFEKTCRDRFLSLIPVIDCSASGIFNSLIKCLNEKNIPLKNLIGFTADNCSVMMGKHNGVQAKLKELVPKLIVNGCICHNLNLISIAAASCLPDNIDKLLREVNHHFCNSPSRKEELKNFQSYFGVEVHTILKFAATRWLSRQAAIDRIIEQWTVLQSYFSLGDFENAYGNENISFISNCLNDKLLHLYFIFLSYALKIINGVNLEMQSEDVRVHILMPRMKSLFHQFTRNFISKKILEETSISSLNLLEHHIPIGEVYCGTEAEIYSMKENLPTNLILEFKGRCKEFYIKFCENLRKKIKFDDQILNFLPKFSPANVISGETNSILPLIVNFFPENELNQIETINTEYRALADCEVLKKYKNYSIAEFWAEVALIRNELNEPMFGNIYRIAQGLLSIPHSSANVERIFSFHNLIKTKCRNRLQLETCSALIQTKDLIKLDSCHNFKISQNLLKKNLPKTALEQEELLE